MAILASLIMLSPGFRTLQVIGLSPPSDSPIVMEAVPGGMYKSFAGVTAVFLPEPLDFCFYWLASERQQHILDCISYAEA
jgi:hypothetical protein